jgi:hypothetical protein
MSDPQIKRRVKRLNPEYVFTISDVLADFLSFRQHRPMAAHITELEDA